MSERKKYLYGLVRRPQFYAWFQGLLGSHQSIERIIREVIRPQAGMRVLDVGCGPATIRPFLGDIHYTGVDLNASHIKTAKKNGQLGDRYIHGNVVTDLSFEQQSFDLITLIGILHHIDDEGARLLFQRLGKLLAEGGRIITFDGVYLKKQRLIAKLMLDRDAGENVRTKQEYIELCKGLPLDIDVTIFNDLLRMPYDHCVMNITHTTP